MIVETQYYTFAESPLAFDLECGKRLSPVTLAYETYGELNAAGDNAILIVHGFTADAHAAGVHAATGRVGWWDEMIGPNKAFDTNRFFVVCANVIGGCSGSTGPSSTDPETGRPFGSAFPIVSIGDMVESQYRLLTALGVKSLASVSGASMGGQQALEWMVSHPEFVRSAIPIACSSQLSALSLALIEVSRRAIVLDPDWRGGDYYGKSLPMRGLAVARMAAHLTYVSGEYLEAEFGRKLGEETVHDPLLGGEFEVQRYLWAEADNFVKRFDANSFVYLSRAIEQFDLTRDRASLADVFTCVQSRVLLLSFITDWLFPVAQVRDLEIALRDVGAEVNHVVVDTPYGHDAFLTDCGKISPLIAQFLG